MISVADFELLEQQIEALVKVVNQLRAENQRLQQTETDLKQHCESLQDKTSYAAEKVKQLINQLKMVERNECPAMID